MAFDAYESPGCLMCIAGADPPVLFFRRTDDLSPVQPGRGTVLFYGHDGSVPGLRRTIHSFYQHIRSFGPQSGTDRHRYHDHPAPLYAGLSSGPGRQRYRDRHFYRTMRLLSKTPSSAKNSLAVIGQAIFITFFTGTLSLPGLWDPNYKLL